MDNNNKFLPAYRDIMFKNLFGVQENIEFVTDMLERLLDLELGSLSGAVVTNSVKLNKETVENKHFEMDIFIRFATGEEIVLEMQNTYDEDSEIKNTMYLAGSIYKSLKVGEDYKEAKKVSGITFTKNMEIKSHRKNKLIQRYFLTNENDINDKILPELYSVMIVNLEYVCEDFKEVPSGFVSWMKFLSANTLEEMYEVSKENIVLTKAYKECRRFMNLDYVQNFEADEKLRRSRELRHIEEAEQRKAKEMAFKMLKSAKDIDEIIEFTELTKEELYELVKEDSILGKVYPNYESFKQIDYIQNFEADEKLRRSREKRHLKEAKEEGLSQGEKRKTIEIAKKMLEKGKSFDEINEYLDLTEEEINNLKIEIE